MPGMMPQQTCGYAPTTDSNTGVYLPGFNSPLIALFMQFNDYHSRRERDDIVFVEKDMAEESRVTPLKDRGARTTEPLESRYLRGLYGAVPRVRDR